VDAGKVIRAVAEAYEVDTDAITLKVKQEFAAKEKARKAAKPDTRKPQPNRNESPKIRQLL
jgi:ParB family chromosome partitioning protein